MALITVSQNVMHVLYNNHFKISGTSKWEKNCHLFWHEIFAYNYIFKHYITLWSSYRSVININVMYEPKQGSIITIRLQQYENNNKLLNYNYSYTIHILSS